MSGPVTVVEYTSVVYDNEIENSAGTRVDSTWSGPTLPGEALPTAYPVGIHIICPSSCQLLLGIVPTMATPQPFIRMEKGGKWHVCDEGRAVLQTVKPPMVVIAVAGLYRTGKSFLLNHLAGTTGAKSKHGFTVGSTSETCTRGIDVLVPPPVEGAAGSVVLLDTEGLASMEQDEAYDAQIFALGLLLSSYFVLNSMGVIDEAAIDRLYLIGELSKHICVASRSGEEADGGGDGSGADADLASFFPPLLWLLRDFVVELRGADGEVRDISDLRVRSMVRWRCGALAGSRRARLPRAIARLAPVVRAARHRAQRDARGDPRPVPIALVPHDGASSERRERVARGDGAERRAAAARVRAEAAGGARRGIA